jgi:hypothetical protein
LTIARFTTNCRVCFRHTDERGEYRRKMIAAPTFAEAAMMALADGRPLYDRLSDEAEPRRKPVADGSRKGSNNADHRTMHPLRRASR